MKNDGWARRAVTRFQRWSNGFLSDVLGFTVFKHCWDNSWDSVTYTYFPCRVHGEHMRLHWRIDSARIARWASFDLTGKGVVT